MILCARLSSIRSTLACTTFATFALPAAAQSTVIASLTPSGAQTTEGVSTSDRTAVSSDGRYVMFSSVSASYAPPDNNLRRDVLVRDMVTGAVDRVSLTSTGAESTGNVTGIAMTSDARFVLMFTNANGMTPNDSNGNYDAFLRDRQSGTLELVTLDENGNAVPGGTNANAITPDGRFVLFSSSDATVVSGDTNGQNDVFVRDRQLATTERVSLGAGGVEAAGTSLGSAISPDGRFILFQSTAPNLVPGDTNFANDFFVRDRQLGTTERVTVSTSGVEQDAGDFNDRASMSADGRIVAFSSWATNLVAADTNGLPDVFVRDLQAGTTTRVSVTSGGTQADGVSSNPKLTADGRFLVFSSQAFNLHPLDTNGVEDVFLRDLALGTLELVSARADGRSGNNPSSGGTVDVTADARFVTFSSTAKNLVTIDANNTTPDVFLRDRASPITSFCAGDGSLVDHTTPCPCGNDGLLGRGCAHSFDAAGAYLDTSGYVANDDVTLRAHALPSTSFTLFLQHDAAGDAVFHDGVLCAGGTLVRLRGRAAVAGEAFFPNVSFPNDATLTLSQRGGVFPGAGVRRYYSGWFRNASTTFCPPATANVTNGLTIDW